VKFIFRGETQLIASILKSVTSLIYELGILP